MTFRFKKNYISCYSSKISKTFLTLINIFFLLLSLDLKTPQPDLTVIKNVHFLSRQIVVPHIDFPTGYLPVYQSYIYQVLWILTLYCGTHNWLCVQKMLNHGLNHWFFLSLFKLISCPIHWIVKTESPKRVIAILYH